MWRLWKAKGSQHGAGPGTGGPSSGSGGEVSAQVAEQENRVGLCIYPHPPVPGKEKTLSVFIWTRNQTGLGHVWLYKTPELRDQNCCELGGGHQPHPCAPPGPSPFFRALGGMVRTLQPPAAARHWVQPLGGGYFLGSPLHAKPTARLSHKSCNQPGFMEKTEIPSCSGH